MGGQPNPTGEPDAAVVPHPSLEAALDAAFAMLDEAGHGRWKVVEGLDRACPGAIALAVTGDAGAIHLVPEPASSRPGLADGQQRRLIVEIARIVATVIAADRQAARAEERAARTERESSLDTLTGVANAGAWWRLLDRHAERCIANEEHALVAVVDLDELKETNDEHGHLAGDLLLRTAADALVGSVHADDVVARVGGDEFAVLFVDPGPLDPDLVARRLTEALAAAGVHASAGAARYVPGDRINDTYHCADRAMYRAKAAREGRRGRAVRHAAATPPVTS